MQNLKDTKVNGHFYLNSQLCWKKIALLFTKIDAFEVDLPPNQTLAISQNYGLLENENAKLK